MKLRTLFVVSVFALQAALLAQIEELDDPLPIAPPKSDNQWQSSSGRFAPPPIQGGGRQSSSPSRTNQNSGSVRSGNFQDFDFSARTTRQDQTNQENQAVQQDGNSGREIDYDARANAEKTRGVFDRVEGGGNNTQDEVGQRLARDTEMFGGTSFWLVFGLFIGGCLFLAYWYRRHMRGGMRSAEGHDIPVSIVGQTMIDATTKILLIRVGNKILVTAKSNQFCTTLDVISDPHEINLLTLRAGAEDEDEFKRLMRDIDARSAGAEEQSGGSSPTETGVETSQVPAGSVPASPPVANRTKAEPSKASAKKPKGKDARSELERLREDLNNMKRKS